MSVSENQWFAENFDGIPVTGITQPQPKPVETSEPQLDEWSVLELIKQAGGSVSPYKFHSLLERDDITIKRAEDILWEHSHTGLLTVSRGPAPPGTHPAEVTIHADIFRKNPELKRAVKKWNSTQTQPQPAKTQQMLKPQSTKTDRVDPETLLDLFQ